MKKVTRQKTLLILDIRLMLLDKYLIIDMITIQYKTVTLKSSI